MAAAISRAFTRRNRRPEISTPMPTREGQVKHSAGTVHRSKISGPVELLSSTNMLAYTAPDLASMSSSSSLRSRDDSDVTPASTTSSLITTPSTSTENSPIGAEPNHLSGYFPKRSATLTSTARSSTSSTGADTSAPHVPKRALSHTKRSHQELARQRSISRMSPPPSFLGTPVTRLSQDFFSPVFEAADHPFSRELDKVKEVAEDFGASRVLDEEEQILLSKGLKKFSLEDYLSEIEDLYGGVFDDHLGPIARTAWL